MYMQIVIAQRHFSI